MPLITVLQGLPASGKSTWAKEKCTIDNMTKRVNKDDLRAMLGGKHTQGFERLVKNVRDHIIRECMTTGYNVIVDDTNFHPSHILRVNEIVAEYPGKNYNIEILEFITPFETCVERDNSRVEAVGYKVIANMAKMRAEHASFIFPNKKSTITI